MSILLFELIRILEFQSEFLVETTIIITPLLSPHFFSISILLSLRIFHPLPYPGDCRFFNLFQFQDPILRDTGKPWTFPKALTERRMWRSNV